MNFKYFLGVLALATLSFTISCSSEEENVDASGTFEAREVIVSSEANGRIINLNLQEGKELIDGEIYGLIDTVQLSLKKRQLQASIDVAATKYQDVSLQTDALKERIKTANKEVKRVKNLISAGAANKKQLDDLNASLLVMKKELAATEYALNSVNKSIDAEINAMKVQLEQIDDQLVRSKIVSPISGIVLAQYAQEGKDRKSTRLNSSHL